MSERTYDVEVSCSVRVTVHDPDAIERVVGPNGNEWRGRFYALSTVEDVLEHWTFNAIHNGVREINRLDGWADLATDAVTVTIMSCDPWAA